MYITLVVGPFKDRQQEAERDFWFLTLLSSYFLHINILYVK